MSCPWSGQATSAVHASYFDTYLKWLQCKPHLLRMDVTGRSVSVVSDWTKSNHWLSDRGRLQLRKWLSASMRER